MSSKHYWSYVSPGFVEIFLLHQKKKKNASAFAHFQANPCVFLNGSFGNASSRPVVLLSFHVARGSVWLGRGFCCANASRICFSASYSVGGTEAGTQSVAIIPSRSMACFTIALIVRTSGDELLRRRCLKKGRRDPDAKSYRLKPASHVIGSCERPWWLQFRKQSLCSVWHQTPCEANTVQKWISVPGYFRLQVPTPTKIRILHLKYLSSNPIACRITVFTANEFKNTDI